MSFLIPFFLTIMIYMLIDEFMPGREPGISEQEHMRRRDVAFLLMTSLAALCWLVWLSFFLEWV